MTESCRDKPVYLVCFSQDDGSDEVYNVTLYGPAPEDKMRQFAQSRVRSGCDVAFMMSRCPEIEEMKQNAVDPAAPLSRHKDLIEVHYSRQMVEKIEAEKLRRAREATCPRCEAKLFNIGRPPDRPWLLTLCPACIIPLLLTDQMILRCLSHRELTELKVERPDVYAIVLRRATQMERRRITAEA